MKLQQAKEIINMVGGQSYAGGGSADTGFNTQAGGGGGGGGSVPDWMTTDWAKLGVDPQFVQLLVQAQNDVGLAQQLASMGIDPYILNDVNAVANAYYSLSNDQKQYMGFNVGVKADKGEVRNFGTAKAPNWRISYDNWLSSQPYDPNTGKPLGPNEPGYPGNNGGVTPSQSAQLGYDYATLAQRVKEYQQTVQQNQMANVNARATGGISLGNFARDLANDQYNRALNPGNYPAYLAASAGTMPGAGSPIEQLLGKGVSIQPPEGGNPLTDPRFQNLMNQEYGYAQPQSLQTVYDIMNQNGGTLPQAFYDYTHTQNPNAATPQYAKGGTQMLNEPVIGVGLHSGTPKFLAGEAGQEKLTFSPVHAHSQEGRMPVPHQHTMGDLVHEHTGPLSQPSFKHYAAGGMAQTSYTPAQGTNISAGKALQALGYVPQYVIQQLMQGNAPTPGSLGEDWYNRMPISLQQLLNSGIQAQVGGTGLEDYLQRVQQYQMPGLSSSTMIGANFQ